MICHLEQCFVTMVTIYVKTKKYVSEKKIARNQISKKKISTIHI